MNVKKQIIAMGGARFSMDPENLALYRYILRQSDQARPKVCFLPTASGDAESYIFRFYESFSKLDCQPSYCSLFHLPKTSLEDFILSQDIIYVGGGNIRSMMALWREWGLDRALRNAYEAGTILSGISAGGNCWFEEGLTNAMPGEIAGWPCLGFLPGSFCPHFDGEADRRPAFQRLLREGAVKPGYAADDGAALHFVDGELARVVSSRPEAKAYRLSFEEGEVREVVLETAVLPAEKP